ncbi:MAG: ATP-dependent DNA ligase [Candidatus Diapherotrites archaeon]|nr:ATP-dependent DNA ligase [Candidatus Diapherotrites archaeon]
MRFRELAEYFDKIQQVQSRLKMTGIIAEMLQKTIAGEIELAIYLSQGRLGPGYLGLEAGLGEKLVEESIARASGFLRKEINEKYKELGDLGLVAEFVSSKKKQQSLYREELSVKKVFENFEKIAKASGAKSQDIKMKMMAELLNSATPLEARFIARIPIGNMRLGIGDPTIMDALAIIHSKEFFQKEKKEVEEIKKSLKEKKEEKRKEELERKIKFRVRELVEEKYNIFPDLGKIARMLKEKGLEGLKEVTISIGIPIRPTLAERLSSAEEIVEKIGKCLVEQKYDGFRLQLHKDKEKIIIFSRQSENVTHMFPELIEAAKKQLRARQVVVEGEALAFNEATKEYFPFQVTIQRKRKYEIQEKAKEFPLKLFLFDIMLLENENQMLLPLEQRRKTLAKILKEGETIALTNSIITDDPKKIDEFFEQSVEQGLEGIIAKDLKAKYIAGARKFAWIKLKRSYKGELNDSVDVTIIGYYKGRGKRAQFGLGGLLTAVYNSKKDAFESIAKIGTGMSEQNLVELEKMLAKTKTEKKPARVESELEPDYWVEPKYVLEVRADEITKSPIHTAGKANGDGFALRFPRMVSFRADKKPEQSTTTEEIIKMFRQQKHVQIEGEKVEQMA